MVFLSVSPYFPEFLRVRKVIKILGVFEVLLGIFKKTKEKKDRGVLLFAEPLKSLETKGKTAQKSKGNQKTKKSMENEKRKDWRVRSLISNSLTQSPQRSKKFEISSELEISSDNEIFARATHRGPIFVGTSRRRD